jgi:hypothetical protein
MTPTKELRRLHGAATQGEWAYRPLPFDDWGYIRGPATNGNETERWPVCVAKAGRYVYAGEDAYHRGNKTDPYAANADAIVALHNAAPALALTAAALRVIAAGQP